MEKSCSLTFIGHTFYTKGVCAFNGRTKNYPPIHIEG